MINSIKVTNHLGESIIIELRKPEESGFQVLYIEGLGPSKADISLTKRSGIDGSVYNSARAGHRNVVLGLGYVGVDVEVSRLNAYKYFPIKKNIRLDVVSNNRAAYTQAYVESNEPDIFSNEASCVISLLCPEAYLFDVDQMVISFSSVTPLFEFPFSNESLVTPLLELSELDLLTEKVITYDGDASIGFLIHIHATGAASGVTITDSITLDTIAIDSTKLAATTGSDIVAGDDIYISTVNGNKYAILVRGSTIYNILNCLGTDPTWFQLEKGDNIYAYTATSGITNLTFAFTNDVAYEGV